MSDQKKIIQRICRRATCLLSVDPAKTIRIEPSNPYDPSSKYPSHHTAERQLIARCYQIS